MVISGPLNGSKRRSAPLFIINKEMVICQLQYYHALSDICCPGNSRYGSPWCPVLRGEQFLEAHVAITNTSRVADQVHALNCAVLGPNTWVGPVHYQEVRSGPLEVRPGLHF